VVPLGLALAEVAPLSKTFSAVPRCTDSFTGGRFKTVATQLRVILTMDRALLGLWAVCNLAFIVAVGGQD
jgi:hypothetical protein